MCPTCNVPLRLDHAVSHIYDPSLPDGHAELSGDVLLCDSCGYVEAADQQPFEV